MGSSAPANCCFPLRVDVGKAVEKPTPAQLQGVDTSPDLSRRCGSSPGDSPIVGRLVLRPSSRYRSEVKQRRVDGVRTAGPSRACPRLHSSAPSRRSKSGYEELLLQPERARFESSNPPWGRRGIECQGNCPLKCQRGMSFRLFPHVSKLQYLRRCARASWVGFQRPGTSSRCLCVCPVLRRPHAWAARCVLPFAQPSISPPEVGLTLWIVQSRPYKLLHSHCGRHRRGVNSLPTLCPLSPPRRPRVCRHRWCSGQCQSCVRPLNRNLDGSALP